MMNTTEVITIRKNPMDIELLKKIIRMDKTKLFDFLDKELRLHYNEIDTNENKRNYLFCKGNYPVVVVAHLDTVFEKEFVSPITLSPSEDDWYWQDLNDVEQTATKEIFQDRVEEIMWSPEGLGADDRVGVFLILSLVYAGLKPHILFTTDEEIGSASGLEFATNYLPFIEEYKINYFMELDRSGYNDCVFYNCDNKSFRKYIKQYGFEEDQGSFTDISVICPILGIAGVNLSVGYFNEHSKTEMIDLFTMSKNFDIIYYMVKESKKYKNSFAYIPKPKPKKNLPKEEDFEIILGGKDRSDSCIVCSTPMEEYLYAKELGKVCIDCYMELYLKGGI